MRAVRANSAPLHRTCIQRAHDVRRGAHVHGCLSNAREAGSHALGRVRPRSSVHRNARRPTHGDHLQRGDDRCFNVATRVRSTRSAFAVNDTRRATSRPVPDNASFPMRPFCTCTCVRCGSSVQVLVASSQHGCASLGSRSQCMASAVRAPLPRVCTQLTRLVTRHSSPHRWLLIACPCTNTFASVRPCYRRRRESARDGEAARREEGERVTVPGLSFQSIQLHGASNPFWSMLGGSASRGDSASPRKQSRNKTNERARRPRMHPSVRAHVLAFRVVFVDIFCEKTLFLQSLHYL